MCRKHRAYDKQKQPTPWEWVEGHKGSSLEDAFKKIPLSKGRISLRPPGERCTALGKAFRGSHRPWLYSALFSFLPAIADVLFDQLLLRGLSLWGPKQELTRSGWCSPVSSPCFGACVC